MRGMTLLHNTYCCYMTYLVTVWINIPQFTTKCCVSVVSEWQRQMVLWGLDCETPHGWVWGGGTVINCTSVQFNFVSIEIMKKKGKEPMQHLFSTKITHFSIVKQLPFDLTDNLQPVCIRYLAQGDHSIFFFFFIWRCTMEQLWEDTEP